MPKKAAAKEKPKQAEKSKLAIQRMPHELRVGDLLVVRLNSDYSVAKSMRISHIERGASCRHYHINKDSCYKSFIPQFIAVNSDQVVPELQPLLADQVTNLIIDGGTE